MKAAVCYEFGQPLVVEEITLDPPQRGEVKVRMVATAICHSDIHIIQGEWNNTVPVLAGHEGAGIVEEVGPGVSRLKQGDRVIVSLLRSCGHCTYCMTGAPHLCTAEFPLRTESRLHNQRGEAIQHGFGTAAFAESIVVDQSQLVVIGDGIALESAALLACGVITGLGAVVNKAKVEPGSSVAVIGVGGVGLNSIQGAYLSGAFPIIAIDLLDEKLTRARDFGATHTVNAATGDLGAAINKITTGRLADYVFVTVGSVSAAEQAYTIAGRGGTVVLVGIPDSVTTLPIPIGPTVGMEKTITGSRMGSTNLQVDVPKLIKLYENGRLKLDELITKRYTLDEINDAIAATMAGSALRNVIIFDKV